MTDMGQYPPTMCSERDLVMTTIVPGGLEHESCMCQRDHSGTNCVTGSTRGALTQRPSDGKHVKGRKNEEKWW